MPSNRTTILRARRTGRAGKYPVMAAMLRERIIAGELKPGERLPPASDLQVEFTTTKATALRAIGALTLHGYLRTEQREGVFVVDHPPHVSQFAIAFPWGLKHAPSQFYRAIHAEAAKLQAPDRHVSMFHDVSYHMDTADSKRLSDLVEHHRLAGLIFAHNPYMLDRSLIVRESGVPRVAIAKSEAACGIPSVYPDLDEFWERALQRFAACGRRRVAVLLHTQLGTPDVLVASMARHCARHGLTTRPEWVHGFMVDTAAWAKPVCQMLFGSGGGERPDALLIADDNFVEPATAGVAAAGVNVPGDLSIVAMANFPHPTPSAVPVERLGFDITRLVAVCMELIGQERRGQTPLGHTAIPALFEEEVGARREHLSAISDIKGAA